MGRVGADLYPDRIEIPLSEVRSFTRFVGGFAGNVGTGLARLGVRTAIGMAGLPLGSSVEVDVVFKLKA